MSKFSTQLEDGYERCPFCNKLNHIGLDIHCRHYLGIELERTIYNETIDELTQYGMNWSKKSYQNYKN